MLYLKNAEFFFIEKCEKGKKGKKCKFHNLFPLGKPHKKSSFFSGSVTKRGSGWVKALPLGERYFFFPFENQKNFT